MFGRTRVLAARIAALLAAALVVATPGTASSATSWVVVATPSPGTSHNELVDVATVSSSFAWAVGHSSDGNHHTLIERWNGAA